MNERICVHVCVCVCVCVCVSLHLSFLHLFAHFLRAGVCCVCLVWNNSCILTGACVCVWGVWVWGVCVGPKCPKFPSGLIQYPSIYLSIYVCACIFHSHLSQPTNNLL